jgi:hypothetical protein
MPDTEVSRKKRGPQPRHRIPLPNGDSLDPRSQFAEELGVSEDAVRDMRLPTRYIANVAYVVRNESLRLIAESPRFRRHLMGAVEPPAPRRRRAR